MERIEITPFTWILLSESFRWMLSIHGCGSCGAAASKQEAIDQVLDSSRLSEKQKEILRNSQGKIPGEQLELF